MSGLIFAILAGALMAIQGVFNTRLTESSSMWVANTVVHSTGLLLCILLWFVTGRLPFEPILKANKLYFLGGLIGAVIVYTVVKSISNLGPTMSVMIFLSSQLIVAYLIELFGIFGTESIDFEFKKLIGMAIVIVGIIVFKI
ncbi:MAG: hypothetical protein CVU84_12370 [Firmicutes bacterium HGW-Firmicutes-1]|jgi:transporter family-2 protein|nr:MAG: hypothetical protein CVU84_12370 [Firmicutes bacterium HGW-Firmicutes-1]